MIGLLLFYIAFHQGTTIYGSSLDDDTFFGTEVRHFRYRSYNEIVKTLKDLGDLYPAQTEVFAVNDRYGVPSPGTCQGEPCKQYVIRITDESDLENDPERPEMFLSGEVHGNERVGPQAVTELAIYMLENYHREVSGQLSSNWFTRMLHTRILYIMPTANALGYAQNKREENNIDPNRDFPYDVHNPHGDRTCRLVTQCMQTTAARAINEMYINHMFQLALTFHGGTNVISYEWGSYNHYNAPTRSSPESPDDVAQVKLGQTLRLYAYKVSNKIPFYIQGYMADEVYPVCGGMEDWAYAASWDTSATTPCRPSTFGGYDTSRTTYTSSQLRTFNMLIETSDNKSPPASTLGDTSSDPLDVGGSGDGHVPRNMRLAALFLDVLQPYVNLVCPCAGFVDDDSDDPGDDVDTVTFQWEVGGAFQVDSTELWWGRWPSHGTSNDDDDELLSARRWIESAFANNLVTGNSSYNTQSGGTRWSTHSGQNGETLWNDSNRADEFDFFKATPFKPFFSQVLETSALWQGMVDNGLVVDGEEDFVDMFVAARAAVDSALAKQTNPEPSVQPQSHFVNARTNDAWVHENNGHRVVGHSEWWSSAVRIRIRNPAAGNSTHAAELTTETPSGTTEAPTMSTTDVPTSTSDGCVTASGILCMSSAAPYAGGGNGGGGGGSASNDEDSASSTSDDAGHALAIVGAFAFLFAIVGFAASYSRWRKYFMYSAVSSDGSYGIVSSVVELEVTASASRSYAHSSEEEEGSDSADDEVEIDL